MNYVSTRDPNTMRSLRQIITEHTTPLGGLYVPEFYPAFNRSELRTLIESKHYLTVANMVLGKYFDEATRRTLFSTLKRVYTEKRFGKDIVPVTSIGLNRYLLQVSEGPTWASKDIALQLYADILEARLEELDQCLNIVVATSGDIGAAAIEAFRGKKRIRVFVLSPARGTMSDVQKQMMYGVSDPNVHNLVVGGYFDDGQAIAKALFNNERLNALCPLGSANSIQWLGIVAQVVYFVWGWSRIAKQISDEVTFAVPRGNFGDAFAASSARKMDIPIRHIIVATNDNDVLDRFIQTGIIDGRGKVIETSSPSMNIRIPSNWERELFEACDRDPKRTNDLMTRLEKYKLLDLRHTAAYRHFFHAGFQSHACSDDEAREVAKYMYQTHRIYLDPHTAVGAAAALRFEQHNVPMVIVETARWEKFPEFVRESLGFMPELSAAYHDLMKREIRMHPIDNNVGEVARYIEEHGFKKAYV